MNNILLLAVPLAIALGHARCDGGIPPQEVAMRDAALRQALRGRSVRLISPRVDSNEFSDISLRGFLDDPVTTDDVLDMNDVDVRWEIVMPLSMMPPWDEIESEWHVDEGWRESVLPVIDVPDFESSYPWHDRDVEYVPPPSPFWMVVGELYRVTVERWTDSISWPMGD